MEKVLRMTPNNQLARDSEVMTTYPLSLEQIKKYHEEGFVIVPRMFELSEIRPIQEILDVDPALGGSRTICTNRDGGNFQVSLWTELGNTLVGSIPRMARIVDAVEALISRECYHWHSKILSKHPGEGGVDWHQGYGSWYENGCLFPDLVTCTIALSANDRENGCLEVLRKSHLLGRLTRVGLNGMGSAGPEPQRLEKIMERLELVYCEMEPGDALFFHANTLHGSAGNQSKDRPRHLMHCTYNAADNAPFILENQEHHRYKKLTKVPDDFIKKACYSEVFNEKDFHPPETAENGRRNIFFNRREDYQ